MQPMAQGMLADIAPPEMHGAALWLDTALIAMAALLVLFVRERRHSRRLRGEEGGASPGDRDGRFARTRPRGPATGTG